MDVESRERAALEAEAQVRERLDARGTRWRQVSFGAGPRDPV